MKRLLIVLTLFCVGGGALAAGQKEQAPGNWAAAKNVFMGWVDIKPDDWSILGYGNAQEWTDVINAKNLLFQRVAQQKLPGRQVVGAKDRTEENAAGQDLQVKFSDVRFDTESYALFLSIHFVDPQTGSDLASVPVRSYRGGHFSIDSCLQGALEKVAEKVGEEIQRAARKKK